MSRKEQAWARYYKAQWYHYNSRFDCYDHFLDDAEDAFDIEWPLDISCVDADDPRWDGIVAEGR